MKIGIVELAFHNEVLRSYINILKSITDDIVCFTNQFCLDQIYDYQEDPNLQWQIKKNENNKKYFATNEDLLSQCDTIIIITLDDDLDFFSAYDWPTKTILLVHDYYSFFETNQINYSGNLEEKARAAKSWLLFKTKAERKKQNKLIDKMTKLAVPSTSVMKFVSERNASPKLTEVLDFAIPYRSQSVQDKSKTVITIPGNVIPKSRDYHIVLGAFKKIIDQVKSTELVILGQAKTSYGRNIVHELEKLENENFTLKYYSSFIDQKEFDEQLRRSSFLLLPISKIMRYRHFKEKNGFTCVSGNINDMLFFGKPAIIPKFYPLDAVHEPIVERYNDEDHLAELLLSWINKKSNYSYAQNVGEVQTKSRLQVLDRFRKALS